MTDPMERMIADSLDKAGIEYETHAPERMDFYLPKYGLHIEVKRFHAARVADQMARAENVIVAQGEMAVAFVAAAIAALGELD